MTACAAAAQADGPAVSVEDLLALDLGRLAEVRMSLGARVDERVFTSASAVYALERDDIRRSGYRRLADLLQLLPGVHSGKADANAWGVSVRNGMHRFSSTLLVMIDGRHVYTPLFGGVRWEVHDVPIDDIERIELVRGPGGPLWGANAVDGIIHVVTRSAAATPGTHVEAGAGRGDLEGDLHLRHGGPAPGGGHWRLSARHLNTHAGAHLPAERSTHGGRRQPGQRAADEGVGARLAARADWTLGADSLSLHAGATRYHFDQERPVGPRVVLNPVEQNGAFTSLDWERRLAAGDALRLRFTLDHTEYDDDVFREQQTLADLDFQHATRLGDQPIVWGLGYRRYRSSTRLPDVPDCGICFGYVPQIDHNDSFSAFVNLPWQVRDDWRLIVGSKLEHSVWAGWQAQPTLRTSWQPTPDQTLWAGIARPVRTPIRRDRGRAFYRMPADDPERSTCRSYDDGLCVVGGPDLPTWKVRSVEAGYRAGLAGGVDLDLAVFDNHYDYGAASPTRARLNGGEAVLGWRPARDWRGELSLARHRGNDVLPDGSRRPTALLSRHTWKLRSLWNLNPQWTLDANATRASARARYDRQLQPLPTLPSTERINLRIAYRPQRSTEIALSLLNLSGGDEAESSEFFFVNTAQRRGGFLSLVHQF